MSELNLNIAGTVVIGIVVLWFLYQAMRYKYTVTFLFVSLISSFIGILIENWLSMEYLQDNKPVLNVIFACHITFIVVYLYFMFLFVNSLVRTRPTMGAMFVVVFLLSVMLVSVWEHAIYFPALSYMNGGWAVSIGRFAYDILGLIVFGWHGMRIYYIYWQKTHEKLSLVFVITQAFMCLGFIVRGVREICSLVYYIPHNLVFDYGNISGWSIPLNICDVLALIAIIAFLFLYIFNIEYILRFPQDIYFLGIYTLSGLKIYRATFKTDKDKFIQDQMLSGIFSTFHSIFKALFKAQHPIKKIQSDDFSLLFKTNENIMIVVATDRPNFILTAAMGQFLRAFEAQYPEIYEDNYLDLTDIEDVRVLIQRNFPFVEITED